MDDVFRGLDASDFGEAPATIPFFVHEAALSRMERTQKRLWILCIIIFLSLVVTNAGWIVYESQFVEEAVTVEQESEGGYNNYIGNDGDITNR